MANEYEHLGFSITAEDTSSSVLDGVIAKLEKISKLTDKILNSFKKFNNLPTITGGKGTGGGGSATRNSTINTISFTDEQQALQHLNQTLQQQSQIANEVGGKISNLSREQLAFAQTVMSATNAQASYEQAQISTANALNTYEQASARAEAAAERLKAAQSSGEQSAIAQAESESYVTQNNLDKATRRLSRAYLTQNKALVNLTSAQIKAGQAQNKLNESAKKAPNSIGKQIISIAAVVKVVKSLTNALVSSLTESGEFIENLNLFAVTFGDTYKETLDWSLDLANNLGFASSEVVRFTGLFKQLATSLEIASDIGDEMSTTLTQLGYDLASFYNIDTESSFEKLQAGIFSGQTKPLRSLGLDVTYQTLDNVLKTEEAFASFGATSKSLDQAAKAQLRLYVVLKNSVNAWGDATKTIESYENQLRVLQGSMSNFKLAIGDVFRDMFSDALVFINGLIQGITAIIRAFVPMQKEVENTSAAMQMYADDTENASEASTSGDLLDFDKFRTLGGGTGGASELASINDVISQQLQEQMAKYEEYMSTLSTKANEVAESLKNWFVTTDENGVNKLTAQAKGLLAVLIAIPTALTVISAHKWYEKMVAGIDAANKATMSLTTSQKLFQAVFSKTGLIVGAVVGVLVLMYTQNEEFRNSVNKLLTALLALIGTALTPIISILNGIAPILTALLNVLAEILTPIINGATVLLELGNGWVAIAAIITTVVILAIRKWLSTEETVKTKTTELTVTLKQAENAFMLLGQQAAASSNKIATAGNQISTVSNTAVTAGNKVSATTKNLNSSTIALTAGITMLVGSVGDLIANWDSMSGAERMRDIFLAIAGAAFLLASALATTKAVATGFAVVGIVAGIVAVGAAIAASAAQAKSLDAEVQGLATGGITDANLIMTNEYGKREWVGQMKNKTAVVNDTQMSTVMEHAVARGVLQANSISNTAQQPIELTITTTLDGEVVYRNQKKVAAKRGEGFYRKR